MNNVIQVEGEVSVVAADLVSVIQSIAKAHPMKRARIVLSQPESTVQEMLIVAYRDTYIRPHRHPKHKTESYLLLHGQLKVRFYDDQGGFIRDEVLTEERFLCRMEGGRYHQPIPLSEWVVYKETYAGPFDKATDVHYAPWSADEPQA